jgi:hypothetical protein
MITSVVGPPWFVIGLKLRRIHISVSGTTEEKGIDLGMSISHREKRGKNALRAIRKYFILMELGKFWATEQNEFISRATE